MSGPRDGLDPLDLGTPQAASQMEAQSSPVYHLRYSWCLQGALEAKCTPQIWGLMNKAVIQDKTEE